MSRARLPLMLLGALAAGCSSAPQGELMLVLQSDFSLPKDIDAVRIEASTDGVPKFENDYTKLGSADGQIHLPGTLALLAPEKADAAVRVVVSARTGGDKGKLRVVREVLTTAPQETVTALPLPIEFLCDGQGKEDDSGDVASDCPEGQTCIAGTCTAKAVDSATLPPYDEKSVFGDGSCFDAARCWTAPEVADLNSADCTIPAVAAGTNVALQTEGLGICGPAGCFVTLDAGSAGGFQETDAGRLALPPAVCEQVAKGKIVNVVTQAGSASCGQKSPSLPTCGPWSAATDNPPPYAGATALAGGQAQPVAVQVGAPGVVWINAGLSGSGVLKSVGIGGGAPKTLTTESVGPRALALVGSDVLWTDAPGGAGAGKVMKRGADGAVSTLVPGLEVPEGIAVVGSKLFFTDFQAGGVFTSSLTGAGVKQLATGNYPYRVVGDARHVYWTNEGKVTSTPADGSVQRIDHTASGAPVAEDVATGQTAPRGIALESDPSGATKAVWWTSFAAAGAVFRAKVSATGALAAAEQIASGLDYPNGIAVDGAHVYWTNRNAGTVMSLPLGAAAGDAPATVAEGQASPGAIAVDDEAVYWVAEGTAGKPTGAVVRLPK